MRRDREASDSVRGWCAALRQRQGISIPAMIGAILFAVIFAGRTQHEPRRLDADRTRRRYRTIYNGACVTSPRVG